MCGCRKGSTNVHRGRALAPRARLATNTGVGPSAKELKVLQAAALVRNQQQVKVSPVPTKRGMLQTVINEERQRRLIMARRKGM